MLEISRRTALIGWGICFLLILVGFVIDLVEGFRSTWSLTVGIFGLVSAISILVIIVSVKPKK